MSEAVLEAAETQDVDARVRYINADWKGRAEAPRIGSRESRRANTAYQPVRIRDARPRLLRGELGLDTTGFLLTGHATALARPRDADHVRAVYYPEMEALVRRLTGAARVIARSHLVRTETPTDFNDGYARFVHCDYNIRRIREMSEEVLRRRGVEPEPGWSYAWYNTWQPFDHPAVNNPLTMIDARSLPADDVIDYYYTGHSDEGSLVAAPVHNPAHAWFYFPAVTPAEAVVLKQMDERAGRAVYCPHTSFDNPLAGADAPPRRSIETRLVAVFDAA